MSISAEPEKRGRPATGKDPMVGFRSPAELTVALDAAAQAQDGQPSRSELIRRIVTDWLRERGGGEGWPLRDFDADAVRKALKPGQKGGVQCSNDVRATSNKERALPTRSQKGSGIEAGPLRFRTCADQAVCRFAALVLPRSLTTSNETFWPSTNE